MYCIYDENNAIPGCPLPMNQESTWFFMGFLAPSEKGATSLVHLEAF